MAVESVTQLIGHPEYKKLRSATCAKLEISFVLAKSLERWVVSQISVIVGVFNIYPRTSWNYYFKEEHCLSLPNTAIALISPFQLHSKTEMIIAHWESTINHVKGIFPLPAKMGICRISRDRIYFAQTSDKFRRDRGDLGKPEVFKQKYKYMLEFNILLNIYK